MNLTGAKLVIEVGTIEDHLWKKISNGIKGKNFNQIYMNVKSR